jgi:hypothetical protein
VDHRFDLRRCTERRRINGWLCRRFEPRDELDGVAGVNDIPSFDVIDEAGTRNARVDFCNLRFDKDKPTVDDPRTYDGLPGSVVVADDVCDPNFVAQWNDAQESAGSDKRACIIDRTLEGIVGRYFCTAPSTVTY